MQFYGQGKLDQYLYETFFKSAPKGVFVECGAFDGHLESTCRFFEESLGWTGINVEPVPWAFERLVINRPKCVNLNCALSGVNSTAKFKHAVHPQRGQNFGNGSLKHTKEHMDDLIGQGCSFDEFDVSCRRFDDLVQENSLPDITLFVLDVEAHELEALDGIVPKVLPKVFCIEHTFVGLDNLKNKLKNNYNFHSLYQHNVMFVRK